MKPFLLFIVLIFLSECMLAQVVYTYDFNSLSVGALHGQDGWVSIQQTAGTADFQVDGSSGTIVSPDATLAVYYNAGGPNVGRTATRKASPNFNFDFMTGSVAELEFDMYRNYWSVYAGVGFDADNDGHVAPGLASEPNDGGILLNVASNNAATMNYLQLPNGTKINFDDNTDGWCRYKLILDFSANSGHGAVALFYMPGCTGSWLAINEVQGVNMMLTPGSGTKTDHAVWDGIFMHSQGAGSGIDNILVRQPPPGQQYQFINFPTTSNKLATDAPFALSATATSGLPVVYDVMAGPATVAGNIVTLTGQAGIVQIKATQPGNAQWVAAPEVFNSFEVVDASAYYAEVMVRRPADTTKVYMSELSPVLLVAEASVLHPEVLSVQQVGFNIQGNIPDVKDWNTGYYTTEWTPPSYGVFTMTVNTTITGGNVTTKTVSFEVIQASSNQVRQAFHHDTITGAENTTYGTFVFPSFAGSFDSIMGRLQLTCPAGGCDIWDRVGSVEARTPTGQWIELFRYITPYNVNCGHNVDLSDFASILQGAVDMRFTIGTQGNGFVVDVKMTYKAGEPEYKYSWVEPIWEIQNFPFGDYANLQPIAPLTWNFLQGTEKAKLKIINTGHGWGDNNSGNAAEFYEATHHIKINGNSVFNQHLWVICNPNPDGCQPQNGTWYHPRAGWCPGIITPFYEYDLSPYINNADVDIFYEFDPGYVDYCHPNHPNCVSGVSCDDCNDTYNPVYIVTGNMISYGQNLVIGIRDIIARPFGLRLFPNPASGSVTLSATDRGQIQEANVRIFSAGGQLQQTFSWDGADRIIPLEGVARGIYILQVSTAKGIEVKKLVVQ